jgi:hypothetical protein
VDETLLDPPISRLRPSRKLKNHFASEPQNHFFFRDVFFVFWLAGRCGDVVCARRGWGMCLGVLKVDVRACGVRWCVVVCVCMVFFAKYVKNTQRSLPAPPTRPTRPPTHSLCMHTHTQHTTQDTNNTHHTPHTTQHTTHTTQHTTHTHTTHTHTTHKHTTHTTRTHKHTTHNTHA